MNIKPISLTKTFQPIKDTISEFKNKLVDSLTYVSYATGHNTASTSWKYQKIERIIDAGDIQHTDNPSLGLGASIVDNTTFLEIRTKQYSKLSQKIKTYSSPEKPSMEKNINNENAFC